MTDTPKKEKKDKKDKKDKKEKKKDKKRIVSLGEAVEPANFRSSDEYLDNERFKPVRNPSFNPALISPLTSPTSSIHSTTKTDEKWIITSNRSRDSLPAVRPESPLTPAELQGFASSKYVPSAGYAHLDPTKHKNAHSAFDQLQKVVMAGNEPQQGQPVPVVQQQTSGQPRSVGQPPQKKSISPLATSKPRSRPERLEDGALVLQYARALWSYTAQISTELTFGANESFAILSKQPDGWWYAELLDKKKRGLVPGNYMTPN